MFLHSYTYARGEFRYDALEVAKETAKRYELVQFSMIPQVGSYCRKDLIGTLLYYKDSPSSGVSYILLEPNPELAFEVIKSHVVSTLTSQMNSLNHQLTGCQQQLEHINSLTL